MTNLFCSRCERTKEYVTPDGDIVELEEMTTELFSKYGTSSIPMIRDKEMTVYDGRLLCNQCFRLVK
jgi:hypothetical protein